MFSGRSYRRYPKLAAARCARLADLCLKEQGTSRQTEGRFFFPGIRAGDMLREDAPRVWSWCGRPGFGPGDRKKAQDGPVSAMPHGNRISQLSKFAPHTAE